MRRNTSDAGGRTESSTELIARITAERHSRTTVTIRTAARTPNGAAAGSVRTPPSPVRPAGPVGTATVAVPAPRAAGRHHSPNADSADSADETTVLDPVTQRVADRTIAGTEQTGTEQTGVEQAHIVQDGPDDADPASAEDREFYPAPGRPARRRSGRPIARRLAPLAVGAAVMLVATTVATLVQPGKEDQVAAPELSGQVVADQTPPPDYLDDVTTTPAPAPTPAPTTVPPAPAPAPAPVPAPPKPAPQPAKDEGVQAAAKKGWKLVGGDEFDGNGLSGEWGAYNGKGHGGNGRRDPGQVSVEGGSLVIRGDGDGNTGGVAYKDGQTHGKWEMRARFPAGDEQYHPVLILWPDSENWPAGGEIDFAETDSAADSVSFFLHYNPSNSQVFGHKDLDITKWHNYAVEWVDGRITGFVDGEKFFESTDDDTMPPGGMHPTIQLDYFPDGGDPEPSEMLVDFMRIYE